MQDWICVHLPHILANSWGRWGSYSITWVYYCALMQIECSPVDVPPCTLVVLELGFQKENYIADIPSNLSQLWMKNIQVISEHRRAIQPAHCIFRWAVLLCLCESGRCTWCRACKALIVLLVGKSSLRLVQAKFLQRENLQLPPIWAKSFYCFRE